MPHAIGTTGPTAETGTPWGRRCPAVVCQHYPTVTSAHSTSACCNTVCVARSSLSGGYRQCRCAWRRSSAIPLRSAPPLARPCALFILGALHPHPVHIAPSLTPHVKTNITSGLRPGYVQAKTTVQDALLNKRRSHNHNHAPPFAAWTIAKMPARMAGGRFGHALTTAARSGSARKFVTPVLHASSEGAVFRPFLKIGPVLLIRRRILRPQDEHHLLFHQAVRRHPAVRPIPRPIQHPHFPPLSTFTCSIRSPSNTAPAASDRVS